MKNKETHNINFIKLKNGSHLFDFKVDNSFFSTIEGSLVEKGNFDINVELIKSETILDFQICIDGVLNLVCDVSLKEFDKPVKLDKKIFVKFGEEYKEESDELIIIPHGSDSFDLAPLFYEYIALEVPFKKIHPELKYSDDDEEEVIIRYEDPDSAVEEKKDDIVDPRWDALRKLKN